MKRTMKIGEALAQNPLPFPVLVGEIDLGTGPVAREYLEGLDPNIEVDIQWSIHLPHPVKYIEVG